MISNTLYSKPHLKYYYYYTFKLFIDFLCIEIGKFPLRVPIKFLFWSEIHSQKTEIKERVN